MSEPVRPQVSALALRAARAVKPDLTAQQRHSLSNGTVAVIGTVANLSLAVCSGLIGGRLHPLAPQAIYALLATTGGVLLSSRNQAVGSSMTSAGMVVAAQLALRGVATLLWPGRDVPTDAVGLANTIGRTFSQPQPTPLPPAVPHETAELPPEDHVYPSPLPSAST